MKHIRRFTSIILVFLLTIGACAFAATVLPGTNDNRHSHSWSSWSTTKKATCKQKGKKTRRCTSCGEVQTQTTKMTPHRWGGPVVKVEVTEISDGETEFTCTICGTSKTEITYPEGTLKRGDKGDPVKEYQEALNDAGYNCGNPDGVFGEKTEKSVKEFQRTNGLDDDGIIRPGFNFILDRPLRRLPKLPRFVPYMPLLPNDTPIVSIGKRVTYYGHAVTNTDCTIVDYNGKPIAHLAAGTEVVILSEKDSWYQIKNPLKTGTALIRKEYVDTNDGLNAGDVLNYEVRLEVADGAEVIGLTVTDPKYDGGVLCASTNVTGPWSEFYTYTYTITAEDVAGGLVDNTARADWTDAKTGEAGNITAGTAITIVNGSAGSMTDDSSEGTSDDDKISFTKGYDYDGDKEYFEEGETILYHLSFRNRSETDTLTNVVVSDPMYTASADHVIETFESVGPEGMEDVYFEYVVTAEDVARGYIYNVATVSYSCDGEHCVTDDFTILTGPSKDDGAQSETYPRKAVTNAACKMFDVKTKKALYNLAEGTEVLVTGEYGDFYTVKYVKESGPEKDGMIQKTYINFI